MTYARSSSRDREAKCGTLAHRVDLPVLLGTIAFIGTLTVPVGPSQWEGEAWCGGSW